MTLSAHDVRRVAVAAKVDPRTVKAYVAGKTTQSTTSALIARALAECGLSATPAVGPFRVPPRDEWPDKALVIDGGGPAGNLELYCDPDDVNESAQLAYAEKIVRILNAHWNDPA